ncbi:DUF4347 domain-containing protein, partial [Cysteiniphilum litorale]|uniref:DUF4347 domain-containing protein n=2 Tax=Cysteiniphilum TaxID=2056696 RepID=UPI000E3415E7
MIKKVYQIIRQQLSEEKLNNLSDSIFLKKQKHVEAMEAKQRVDKVNINKLKKKKGNDKALLRLPDQYPSLLQELEPRFMFDGAAIETVDLADGVSEQEQIYILNAIDQNEQAHATESLLQAIEANVEGFQTDYSKFKEVVIVDARVKDPHILIDSISRKAAIEVILPDQDGVDKIAELLAKYNNLDAVHIISHGDQAKLELGSVDLTSNNLAQYQMQLQQWGQALTEQGDILFYGCNVAEGDKGQAFINELRALTSADIAASEDITGAEHLGGDSILEYTQDVENGAILSFSQYLHQLTATQLGQEIVGDGVDDQFGSAVAMSQDGTRMAVGASETGNGTGPGYVKIYQWNSGTSQWDQMGSTINGDGTNDLFGNSITMNLDGSRVAIGAQYDDNNGVNSGSVKVYDWNSGTSQWDLVGSVINGLTAGDQFGFDLSLSANGSILVIGAPFNDEIASNAGQVRVYEWNGSAWVQKGNQINGLIDSDNFGSSVSISDDGLRFSVGARLSDANGTSSGSVTVYQWNSGTSQWDQMGSVLVGEAAGDQFFRTSISGDGSRLAVGARLNGTNDIGHVRVFEWNSGASQWQQIGSDIDGEFADDNFGSWVSLNIDGTRLAASAYFSDGNGADSGSVRLFDWNATTSQWEQFGVNINGEAAGDEFGLPLALNANGDRLVVGAKNNDSNGSNSGHIIVYEVINDQDAPILVSNQGSATLTQVGGDITGDNSNINVGSAVASNIDGSIVAISDANNAINAINAGRVRVYRDNNGTWELMGQAILGTVAYDQLGANGISLSADGLTLSIGVQYSDSPATDAGRVDVYSFNGSSWVLKGNSILGENLSDYAGYSVSLSADGNRVAVGAYGDDTGTNNRGSVRIYEYNSSTNSWIKMGSNLLGDISSTSDYFGISVALSADGTIVAAGGKYYDQGATDRGHVKVYQWNGSSWSQLGTDLIGTLTNDTFGGSVSLSADGLTLAVGAEFANRAFTYQGEVKIFNWNGSSWVQKGRALLGAAAFDRFGSVVQLSADGETLSVSSSYNDGGGTDAGRVYLYRFNGDWQLLDTVSGIAEDLAGGGYNNKGTTLSADGQRLVVGYYGNDTGFTNAGLARVFDINYTQLLLSYNQTSGSKVIDNSISVFDISVDNLVSALVTISGNYVQGEDVLDASVTGTNITKSFNATTGVLSLTGVDSLANYQQVLRSVSYSNTIFSNTATRTVSFVINDGMNNSTALNANIELTTQAPSIATSQGSATLTQVGGDITGDNSNINVGSAVASNIDGSIVAISDANNAINAINAGRVRVYRDNNGTWELMGQAILGTVAYDQLGANGISLSADGLTLSIGVQYSDSPATDAGRVDVYSFNGSSWVLKGNSILGENLSDYAGYSVSLSADGNRVAVGAYGDDTGTNNRGSVRIYEYNSSTNSWIKMGSNLLGDISSTSDYFGISVALSADGTIVAAGGKYYDQGATDRGHVKVYQWNGSSWNQLGTDLIGTLTNDLFGSSVSLSADGLTLAVGAEFANRVFNSQGEVKIFIWNGSSWVQKGTALLGAAAFDRFGSVVQLSADGETLSVSSSYNDGGGTDAGRVYLYRFNGDWQLLDTVSGIAANDLAGGGYNNKGTTLSADGQRLVVGYYGNDTGFTNAGLARVFQVNYSGSGYTYNEDDPAQIIDNSLVISDIDSSHLVSATISISNGFNAAEDILAFTALGNITGSYNASTGVLSLSGNDTIANYQTVLRSVTYQSNQNISVAGSKEVSFVVNDGLNSSVAEVISFNVAPVNDPPVNTVPGAQSVDEDSTLVFNTANSNLISVADADHAALSVTLTVTKGRLTLSQTTGLTFVIGSNGESRMKFSGSITDINAALNGLIYAGNPDFTGSDSLTILSEDND